MSRFDTQYHVARSSGRCAATGQVLEPGSACMAALVELPEQDTLQRQDYSMQAWESGVRPEGLFSYWKTQVPDDHGPAKNTASLVDDEVLLDIFARLGEDTRPQRVAFRFVLGLILMRKKLLKFAGRTVTQKGEVWQLRPRGDADQQPLIEMLNPNLSDEDVREITDQLREILQSEV